MYAGFRSTGEEKQPAWGHSALSHLSLLVQLSPHSNQQQTRRKQPQNRRETIVEQFKLARAATPRSLSDFRAGKRTAEQVEKTSSCKKHLRPESEFEQAVGPIFTNFKHFARGVLSNNFSGMERALSLTRSQINRMTTFSTPPWRESST